MAGVGTGRIDRLISTVRENELVRTQNQLQGDYGELFVGALAMAAGLAQSWWKPDLGIDLTLHHLDARGAAYHGAIDVQVKTWRKPKASDTHWRFRMETEHFNALAGQGFDVPRFIFLLIVPERPADYANARSDVLELRHAAYWHSLANSEPLPEPFAQATVTVQVPRANLLTVGSLMDLFVKQDTQVAAP